MQPQKEALIFFSYKSHKLGYIEMLFARLTEAASGRNLRLTRGSLSDLHIKVIDNKMSIVEALSGRSLDSFDVIYFELWYKAQQQALAAATYASRHGTPFFSEEIELLPAMTKVGEIAILADQNIPIPNTFVSSRRELLKVFKAKKSPIPYPLIVKAADGYGGKTNFLVRTYQEFKEVLNSHKGVQFIVQEFIPNDRDYRCLVFGGRVKLVLQRSRDTASESHLNNTSQGAAGEIILLENLPAQAIADVESAALALNRSSFAGVDLLIDSETGQHYILEVNQTPQVEIGAAVDQKMSALLDHMESVVGKDSHV